MGDLQEYQRERREMDFRPFTAGRRRLWPIIRAPPRPSCTSPRHAQKPAPTKPSCDPPSLLDPSSEARRRPRLHLGHPSASPPCLRRPFRPGHRAGAGRGRGSERSLPGVARWASAAIASEPRFALYRLPDQVLPGRGRVKRAPPQAGSSTWITLSSDGEKGGCNRARDDAWIRPRAAVSYRSACEGCIGGTCLPMC
ncbi:hypothetical protein LY76DRAFT_146084 [Colletotrichum caudatum]|nr:hypothetical protein LY76DRAFT_146084 [Colletotrichum caudatum]